MTLISIIIRVIALKLPNCFIESFSFLLQHSLTDICTQAILRIFTATGQTQLFCVALSVLAYLRPCCIEMASALVSGILSQLKEWCL